MTHHPPMVAQYCESSRPGAKPGEDWKCWQEFTMRSRFKGKYLEVEPLGIAHLVFPKTGNHYTWRKGKKLFFVGMLIWYFIFFPYSCHVSCIHF